MTPPMPALSLRRRPRTPLGRRLAAHALALLGLLALAALPCPAHESFTRPAQGSGLAALLRGETRIDAVFFDASTTRLIVIDEGSPKQYGSLSEALRRHGCRAGINGGYFGADARATPLGLIVHGGRQRYRLATGAFTVAGVLSDDGKTIRLERSRALRTPIASMKEALQAGPFLIENGKALEVNTSRWRRFGDGMPGRDILARHRELGGALLTLCSDAHATASAAHGFAAALALMPPSISPRPFWAASSSVGGAGRASAGDAPAITSTYSPRG